MKILSVEKQRSIEEQILLHLIISDRFCHTLCPVINLDFFQIDSYRIIAKWIYDYWEKHKKSPKKNIKKIYQVEKVKMDDEEAKIISSILTSIKYQEENEENINIDYAIENASKYFRKRDLTISADLMQEYLRRDMLDEAEIVRYKINTQIQAIESGSNTFSMEAIEECFDESNNSETFSFNGYMNNIVGKIERGHFIAFMGPPKRGKTTWLVECASQALVAGLKVAFFSFEMRRRRINQRFYQRFGGLLLPSYYLGEKIYEYPIVDCKKNQNGECDYKIRKNKITLFEKGQEKPSPAKANPDYQPCSVCYDDPKLNEFFELAVWFEIIRNPTVNIHTAQKVAKAFAMYEKNLKVFFYPRGTKSLDEIIQKLNILEHIEKFRPDVVIVDYLDITKIGNRSKEDRHNLNAVWEQADGYSTEKNIVFISATQAGRTSSNRKSLVVEDISEEWRKIAHIDKLIAINQTPEEKRNKTQRIGLLANRDDDFDPSDQALCFQNMSACQPCLNSYRTILKDEGA